MLHLTFFWWRTNLNLSEAVLNAEKMVNDGASFIDVGGESTRPGAKPVSAHEEISRVIQWCRG